MVPVEHQRDQYGYICTYRASTRRLDIVRNALRNLDMETRFNLRGDIREFRQGDQPWREVSRELLSKLRMMLEEDYAIYKADGTARPFRLTGADFKMMLEAIDYDSRVDPFIEWFESRPPWDGEERIDWMLSHLFEEHRDAPFDSLKSVFGRWASRFVFIAAIQLAYYYDSQSPKDHIRTRPLFVGEKGIGKSSMLRNLLPHEYPEWYHGNFIVTNDPLRMIEQTNGVVICECAELAGLTEKTLDVWKAFATGRRNRTRLKFRPDAKSYPQRSVIIGTTNKARFIPGNEDGWQRDLPVLLGHAPRAVEGWIHEYRDQLWAEALSRVQSGERAQLPYALREKAVQHTSRFRKRNYPVEDAVGRLPAEFSERTTTDLLLESGVIRNYQDAHTLPAHVMSIFIDRLLASGCQEVPYEDSEGRIQQVWERKSKDARKNE